MEDRTPNSFPDIYDVIGKIGRGGTADLYLARRRGSARPVVLKKFHVESAPDLVGRECAIADQVRFPGIVRVHGAETAADGAAFLRMEYCEGPTLESLIGRVSETRLLAILSSLAASLVVLHQAGWVHNDLKPSNVFCPAGFDRDDFPLDRLFYLKLGDFSLAENFTNANETAVTGTVGYMSPEMILKQKIYPTSDFFSLGVMAFQLACGRLPFISQTNDPLDINAQITEGDRPPMDGPGQDFSNETAGLIRSLMEIDSSRRPPTANALLEILSKTGSPYPFRKAVRPRHLLSSFAGIDAGVLAEIFGKECFSPAQMKFMENATGFEPAHARLLLEENFDCGNFTRITGRWGWRNDTAGIIQWSSRQSRFGLRPLRGSSISVKKLALALSLPGLYAYADEIAPVFAGDNPQSLRVWQNIPEPCRPGLLYALGRIMRPSSRKAISKRLMGRFREQDENRVLAGRLMFYAENYREAIEFMRRGLESGGLDPDEMQEIIDLSLEAARNLDDIDLQAQILLQRARLEKDRGRLSASENTYRTILALLDGQNREGLLAQTYKEMGDFYKVKNDYPAGIAVLKKALEAYEKIDDPLGLSHALNNLGNMYWIAGDLNKSLKYYEKALTIQMRLRTHKEIATSLNNIGSIYLIQGEYSRALKYYNKSRLIRERLGEKAPIAQSWNNLGAVHFLMGDAVRSAEAFSQSLRLNREAGIKAEELLNIENLAEVTILSGRVQEALQYLKEGSALAESLDETSHKATINRLTGQLLRRMGYYDEAEAKLKSALTLAEQIDNKATILLCRMCQARMYLALGEDKALAAAVSEAMNIARDMNDKNALFHLDLLQFSHTGGDDFRKEAESLVEQLNTVRDKALLFLTLLERHNRLGVAETSDIYIGQAGMFFEKQPEDIDQARFNLALAQYYYLIEENQRAEVCATRAAAIAGKANLLPEQWQSLAFLSEMKYKGKDYEAAFRAARHAAECLKKIAGHIQDQDRLVRFYNDPRIVALLGRIKSLQTILSKTKGAAVGGP